MTQESSKHFIFIEKRLRKEGNNIKSQYSVVIGDCQGFGIYLNKNVIHTLQN